ncbi:GspH/FimT family pseudopilin [Halomonas sp. TRM85114]|uniref:GspH/FimT family pseudopilin n=1 Tax=Halomonas jincaotanensis TaxID=2810616 RepID=UPI001BD5E32A|nr:GspH/FimT family pseudopilin [Halomonas jincaotanensis]MBS9404899.1 GspH/FimT family pseudopilin [Halomonas jincaotanensis]
MKKKGFTLIELLVTIAVAVILMTTAIPSFQRMMAVSRVAADYNEVLSGLNYARSEAIKKRTDVTFTVNQSEPWIYQVSDGSVLRNRSGRDARTSLSEGFSVTFGSLGKPTGSCATGCNLSLGNTYSELSSRTIDISSLGRVRGGS